MSLKDLTTKADLALTKTELKAEITEVKAEVYKLRNDINWLKRLFMGGFLVIIINIPNEREI